jgi:hypothetical protein
MSSVDSIVVIANRRRLFMNMLSGTGCLIISVTLAFLLMRYMGKPGQSSFGRL